MSYQFIQLPRTNSIWDLYDSTFQVFSTFALLVHRFVILFQTHTIITVSVPMLRCKRYSTMQLKLHSLVLQHAYVIAFHLLLFPSERRSFVKITSSSITTSNRLHSATRIVSHFNFSIHKPHAPPLSIVTSEWNEANGKHICEVSIEKTVSRGVQRLFRRLPSTIRHDL